MGIIIMDVVGKAYQRFKKSKPLEAGRMAEIAVRTGDRDSFIESVLSFTTKGKGEGGGGRQQAVHSHNLEGSFREWQGGAGRVQGRHGQPDPWNAPQTPQRLIVLGGGWAFGP
jgi:hypothetical protein